MSQRNLGFPAGASPGPRARIILVLLTALLAAVSSTIVRAESSGGSPEVVEQVEPEATDAEAVGSSKAAQESDLEQLDEEAAELQERAESPAPQEDEQVVMEEPDPEAVAQFAAAKPLAVNAVTDVEYDGKSTRWFKVQVESAKPVVLRVGGLNTWGSGITVYDRRGSAFFTGTYRDGRQSGWHGRVAAGTWYVRLEPVRAGEDEKLSPEEMAAQNEAKPPPATLRPALLVLVDPPGPGATPRHAAQLGLNYLQVDAPAWQNAAVCNGCHVQSQALMGMALAKANGYRLQERAARSLGEFIVAQKETEEIFAALAVRYFVSGFDPGSSALRETVKGWPAWTDGKAEFDSGDRPPIEAGLVTGNALAVQVLSEAVRRNEGDIKALRALRDTALAQLRSSPAKTVQDHAMKIIAFAEAGVAGEPLAREVQALLGRQNKDGGFSERPARGASNAYATGQALYALRVAGTPTTDPAFTRAVKHLVNTQGWSGTWPLVDTDCESDIAHTMWAVIGLAGSIEASLPVRVAVAARDAAGRFLTDLKDAEFAVLEDGAPQKILEVRRATGVQSIVLVIDTSGSIKPALPAVVKAASSFLRVLDPADRVALEEFNTKVGPPGGFTTDRKALDAELAALKASGGTALYDAVLAAIEALRTVPEPKGIVLLTDGKDEDAAGKKAGSKATFAQTQAALEESGMPLFALGLGRGIDIEVLRKLAGASGGRAYAVPGEKDLEAVYRDLAGALRAQYILTYRSTKPVADGKWRVIEVKVARPGAKVEATPGYTATRDLLE